MSSQAAVPANSSSAPTPSSTAVPDYSNFQTPVYTALAGQMSGLNVSNPGSRGQTPIWSPDERRAMTMVDAQQIRDEFNRRKAAAAAERPLSEVITPRWIESQRRAESEQDLIRRLQEQRPQPSSTTGSNPSLHPHGSAYGSIQPSVRFAMQTTSSNRC